MPRFHNFEGKLVQFTNAEEAARDAEEKAWADAAAARAWEALTCPLWVTQCVKTAMDGSI